jgi:cyanophycin synthetase
MQILSTKVMRGPNYWSNYRKKLIVMKLDLGEYEELPTNYLDGFTDRLVALMPTLKSHRCSVGVEGGFIERMRKGTWLGHVIEHVALELQSLAGMETGFGRTRNANKKGIYNVVFSYEIENAGVYAAKAAVKLVQTLVNDEDYVLTGDIAELTAIYNKERLGPSTQSIVDEAVKRDIPFTRLDENSLIMLGYGARQKLICATVSCNTSSIGVDLASDKEITKQILSGAFIPVPVGETISSEEQLEEAITKIGFPIVIKPYNGNHGRGVTTGINSIEQAHAAYKLAAGISEYIIVEKFITGSDYRFLVVNYKVVAVAKRTPPYVIGDNGSTIEELISQTNEDPRRGDGHENVLTKIKIDEATKSILIQKNLSLNSVLPFGDILYLKDAANLSAGGIARDVSDCVHSHNIFLAERIARLMNLDICGVDIVTRDINVPLHESQGAVVEVNAGPGFRMHLSPAKGLPRNVAEPVIDMLYPPGSSSRIPLVAVTGTNGKTTTVRLIAHIAKAAGHSVGFTTTEGIYINEQEVARGDCSGPSSAAVVLRDPIVDFAVLECARGGILRSGLGFDKCSLGIVTNISEDHLGLNDIETLEELAKVKIVVARSVMDEGYAILNADDDLVYGMKDELSCNIALFSMDHENQRIKDHCNEGGTACFIEDEYVVVSKGEWKTRVAAVKDIPLTFSGHAEGMVQNVLAATLAASLQKFSAVSIAGALTSFIPSAETMPGKMNVFSFPHCRVMVDYAHNEGAYLLLKKYLSTVSSRKIGIVAATGDRRDDDIRKVGFYAAQMFDEIVIRHDKDGRGRSNDDLTSMVMDGILQVDQGMIVTVISDEFDALRHTIQHAPSGSLVVHCADEVLNVIEFVKALQSEYGNGGMVRNIESNKRAS